MKKCEIDTADNIWWRVIKTVKIAALSSIGLGVYAGFFGTLIWAENTYSGLVIVWFFGAVATIFGLGLLFLCGLLLHWIFCIDDRSEQQKCYHDWSGKGTFVKCKKCGLSGNGPKP